MLSSSTESDSDLNQSSDGADESDSEVLAGHFVTGQDSTRQSQEVQDQEQPSNDVQIGRNDARVRYPSTTRRRDFSQHRGRGLRLTRRHLRNAPAASSGERVREILSRPRCGFHLLRALRNDEQLSIPQPRCNPDKPPRCPGRADKHFVPRDGDLLLCHVKKPGKRVVEFYDPEQQHYSFDEGDYLVRFKVDNFSFMQQCFVTARGYMYHHGHWVYLGKDSDQMELV